MQTPHLTAMFIVLFRTRRTKVHSQLSRKRVLVPVSFVLTDVDFYQLGTEKALQAVRDRIRVR